MPRFIRKFIIALFVLNCLNISSQSLHTLSKDLPTVNKEFHLQVYVMLDSLRATNFEIENLGGAVLSANKFFDPIGISFSICGWDTVHNYNFDSLATTIEQHELRTLFHSKYRINIYIADELHEPSICGFASLAGITGPNTAYIYLKKNCPGSLTHELGHLFGLPHTFEGNGSENVNGSNCQTDGDGICDTPADPYNPEDKETIWQDGCEFIYEGRDINGQYYQPNMGNIMSYYGCDCGFTRDQYLKMVNTYLSGTKNIW